MHVDLEKIISSKSSIKMIYILEDSYPCLYRKHCFVVNMRNANWKVFNLLEYSKLHP